MADDQYREGAIDFLSVLSTQRTLLESESEVIEGKKQLALSVVNLYKSFGGGWQGILLARDSVGKGFCWQGILADESEEKRPEYSSIFQD